MRPLFLVSLLCIGAFARVQDGPNDLKKLKAPIVKNEVVIDKTPLPEQKDSTLMRTFSIPEIPKIDLLGTLMSSGKLVGSLLSSPLMVTNFLSNLILGPSDTTPSTLSSQPKPSVTFELEDYPTTPPPLEPKPLPVGKPLGLQKPPLGLPSLAPADAASSAMNAINSLVDSVPPLQMPLFRSTQPSTTPTLDLPLASASSSASAAVIDKPARPIIPVTEPNVDSPVLPIKPLIGNSPLVLPNDDIPPAKLANVQEPAASTPPTPNTEATTPLPTIAGDDEQVKESLEKRPGQTTTTNSVIINPVSISQESTNINPVVSVGNKEVIQVPASLTRSGSTLDSKLVATVVVNKPVEILNSVQNEKQKDGKVDKKSLLVSSDKQPLLLLPKGNKNKKVNIQVNEQTVVTVNKDDLSIHPDSKLMAHIPKESPHLSHIELNENEHIVGHDDLENVPQEILKHVDLTKL